MRAPLRALMVTSAWPTAGAPRSTHFIKRQADFLGAAGVVVDVFHYHAGRNPWKYALAWWRLRRRVARGHYDVLHAQFGQCGLLAFPKRLPLVVTYRGSDLLGIVGRGGRYTLAGRILQRLSQAVARRADAVIVVAAEMRPLLPPSVPVHVIPSGLDFSLFRRIPQERARRQLGLPLDKKLVLFAGNPAEPRKRYALAEAARAIVNRSLPSELVVAWGVPHADIPYYMNACDALVLASLHEGSPNVVKEALACDLAVVAVPVGDVAARLGAIDGCEVCADDRAETIAAALERVLRRNGRVAGRRAMRELDERRLTQRVIDVYRSVTRPRPVTERVVEAPDAIA